MRDSEGKGKWIVGSAATMVVLAAVVAVTRGIGAHPEQTAPTYAAPPASLPDSAPGSPGGDQLLEAQKLVERRVEGLYEQASAVRPSDGPGQQRLVDDYRELALLAVSLRSSMPSGCAVARRAWQVQAFLLAKEAWDSCYLDGEASSRDYAFYAATLRNLGHIWSDSTDARVRYKGLTYLVTCAEIVERYGLAVWECRQDLDHLVGDSSPPPAAASPLLLPPTPAS